MSTQWYVFDKCYKLLLPHSKNNSKNWCKNHHRIDMPWHSIWKFTVYFQPTQVESVFSMVRLRLLMDEDAIQKLAIGAYRCGLTKKYKKIQRLQWRSSPKGSLLQLESSEDLALNLGFSLHFDIFKLNVNRLVRIHGNMVNQAQKRIDDWILKLFQCERVPSLKLT